MNATAARKTIALLHALATVGEVRVTTNVYDGSTSMTFDVREREGYYPRQLGWVTLNVSGPYENNGAFAGAGYASFMTILRKAFPIFSSDSHVWPEPDERAA